MTGMQLTVIPLDEANSGGTNGSSKSSSDTNTINERRMVDSAADAAARSVNPTVNVAGAGGASGCSGPNIGESSSNILSDELREQFETMKAVWRQAKRASSSLSAHDDGEEGEYGENDEEVHLQGQEQQQPRRQYLQRQVEELKRKQRETAVETAVAVDAEVQRWKDGIADLEALLAAEDLSSGDDDLDNATDEEAEESFNGREIVVMRRHPPPPIQPAQQQHHRHHNLQFPRLPPVVPDDDDDDDDAEQVE
jgi:hypothetical protein